MDSILPCPLCKKRLRVKGIEAHRKYKHSTYSSKSFEKLLIEGIKNGSIKPINCEEPNKYLVTSTSRLNHERKHNKIGVRSVVSGGKAK
jgi:hypothetical protein